MCVELGLNWDPKNLGGVDRLLRPPRPLDKSELRAHRDLQFGRLLYMGGCQKYGPFWGPSIIWHQILEDPKEGHNFDSHPHVKTASVAFVGPFLGGPGYLYPGCKFTYKPNMVSLTQLRGLASGL